MNDLLQGTVPLDNFDRGTILPLNIIEPIAWHDQPVPPRRWIVDPLIPQGAVTLITGHGGTGKSTIALQLLVAAALKRDWFRWPTRPCKALGMFCEDTADELHRRTVDIVRHYDAELGDLENLRLVSRVGVDNLLMEFENQWSPGEETALYGQVLNEATNFGAEIVVLDSLHDLYGGNENSRPQARQFVNSLRTIATETSGAVLLVGHPSRAGLESGSGEAGSTAWHNAVRSRLFLRKASPERDGPVEYVLESAKSNYGGKFEPVGLTWSDGVFVRDMPAVGMMDSLEKSRAETVFLDCLDTLDKQGINVSPSEHAGSYAPRTMARMPESGPLGQRQLELAMHRLLSAETIHNAPYGAPSRGSRRLERVDEK